MLQIVEYLKARMSTTERGAAAVEYGMLVALIAAVIVAIVADSRHPDQRRVHHGLRQALTNPAALTRSGNADRASRVGAGDAGDAGRPQPLGSTIDSQSQHNRPSARAGKGAHDDFPAHRGIGSRHRARPARHTRSHRVRAQRQGPSDRRREAGRRLRRQRQDHGRHAGRPTSLEGEGREGPRQGAGHRRRHQPRPRSRAKSPRSTSPTASSSSRAASLSADAQSAQVQSSTAVPAGYLPEHGLARSRPGPRRPGPRGQPRGGRGDRHQDRQSRRTASAAAAKVIARDLLVTTVQIDGDQGQTAGREATVDTAPTGKFLVTLAVTQPDLEALVTAVNDGTVWLAADPGHEMSDLLVASPSETFGSKIAGAFGDHLNGHRRYWRDGLLDNPRVVDRRGAHPHEPGGRGHRSRHHRRARRSTSPGRSTPNAPTSSSCWSPSPRSSCWRTRCGPEPATSSPRTRPTRTCRRAFDSALRRRRPAPRRAVTTGRRRRTRAGTSSASCRPRVARARQPCRRTSRPGLAMRCAGRGRHRRSRLPVR